MRTYTTYILACCCLGSAQSLSMGKHEERHETHERRSQLPRGWEKRGRLDDGLVIPLRIALTQSNLAQAHDYLMDVSHPNSANSGKHWTPQQVAETFAPDATTVVAVKSWLADAGIRNVDLSPSSSWVQTNITIAEAEKLLKTSYFAYQHESGQYHVACEDYSLPENLRQHVDFITPTVHFDVKVNRSNAKRALDPHGSEILNRHISESKARKAADLYRRGINVNETSTDNATELAHCDTLMVPDCLRALYGIPADVPVAANNSYGIVEYSPQAYLQADLDAFFKSFAPGLVGQSPILESIDGGFPQTTTQDAGHNQESDLDLEYAMALVYPQNVTLYQAGDPILGASFNDILDVLDASYCTSDGGDDPVNDISYPDPSTAAGAYHGTKQCGGTPITKVISTSYDYDENALSAFYEQRQCNEYLKLGLLGTTVLYSSGASGVAGNGGACIDEETGAYNDGTSGRFNPTFPSSCPYITSVGATQIPAGGSVADAEEAAQTSTYSGGGFSNVFALPSYQADAVAAYFASNSSNALSYSASQYNNSQATRGYPDVSANGVNYVVSVDAAANDGEFTLFYGASAASPTFGAIITLINAARLAVGKSTVGFINPFIYANADMFNDITSGSNPGCGTDGFTAVEGWDPVTGLGTPNFPKMRTAWLAAA
ncbi:Uu.00g110330.m01.CDS01 [Anthostomella pinea]|uniref:tripeptidyl-peptidase II n=1 Tax=Anthostomella pinea TaxID=933095 RepID=A0AAI8VFU6_9PEZI|nr:Uu.00g110330.m01.CDS01 [Anthostomella pinea]